MKSHIIALVLATLIFTSVAAPTKPSTPYKIQSGKIYLQVNQAPTSSPQNFQLSYDSAIKTQLKLTQSSKISIEAKMKFDSESFQPELFSFRLVHAQYDRLTQPVRAVFDTESQSWKVVIDLGDPRTVQPYSDLYKLELIIADQKLGQSVRNSIANIRISFRYSIPEEKIPNRNTPISYKLENIIQTNAPEVRIDPPSTFTIFIVIVMAAISILFAYGLFVYLGANLKLFPLNGIGFFLNAVLVALLLGNLVFLGKFWIQWNFITTIVNLFWLVVGTALIANYALLYIKRNQ